MPYIHVKDRKIVDPFIQDLCKVLQKYGISNGAYPGLWNYVITRLLLLGLSPECSQPGYRDINAAIGVLECAKLELYARVARPYEDKKCQKNGDVYMALNTPATGRSR